MSNRFGVLALVVIACVSEDSTSTRVNPQQDSGAVSPMVPPVGTSDGSVPLQDAGPQPPPKLYAFVTQAMVRGDFAVDAGNPHAAGDAICGQEALGAGLVGTFRAWLSYANANGTPFNASARIANGPYYLPAETGSRPEVLLVASKADLLASDGGIALEPDDAGVTYWRNASGKNVDFDENSRAAWVWTGTAGDGTLSSTCANWTSGDAGFGTTGNARRIPKAIPSDWTSLGGRGCELPRRLYCFQVLP